MNEETEKPSFIVSTLKIYILLCIGFLLGVFAVHASAQKTDMGFLSSSNHPNIGKMYCTESNICILNFTGNITAHIATGTSMLPVASDNDILLLDEDLTPVIGDIVAYKLNDSYVAHQIVDINGTNYVMRGTNNVFNDSAPVQKSQITGVIVTIVKGMNYTE